jgi:hypothetical protein
LSALAGAAVGAIGAHSAAAVSASFVILLVLRLLIRDGSHFPAIIDHAVPYGAWNRLVAVPYPPVGTAYPWTTTGTGTWPSGPGRAGPGRTAASARTWPG